MFRAYPKSRPIRGSNLRARIYRGLYLAANHFLATGPRLRASKGPRWSIKRLLEEQSHTAGDIKLLKDVVERETELALQAHDDRLLLRLLFQRQAAEGYYEDLMLDLGIPGPPKPSLHLADRPGPHGGPRP
jgi:hypothetical protein